MNTTIDPHGKRNALITFCTYQSIKDRLLEDAQARNMSFSEYLHEYLKNGFEEYQKDSILLDGDFDRFANIMVDILADQREGLSIDPKICEDTGCVLNLSLTLKEALGQLVKNEYEGNYSLALIDLITVKDEERLFSNVIDPELMEEVRKERKMIKNAENKAA